MYTDGGNSINAGYNDLTLRDLQTNFVSLYTCYFLSHQIVRNYNSIFTFSFYMTVFSVPDLCLNRLG
jgi:hypothetical protein